jgi:hypothetical protein
MNYLHLTNQQIIEIQSQVSSFDDEEVFYNGSIKLNDESVGDFDKAFSVSIDWLEIKVLDKFYTLIDNGAELKDGIIKLEDWQYDDLSEQLFENYD